MLQNYFANVNLEESIKLHKVWKYHKNNMRGIQGVDRSCFMSATISALAYIPCFSQTLLTHEAFQSVDKVTQPLLAEIIEYFKLLLEPVPVTSNQKKPSFESKPLGKKCALVTDYFYKNKVRLMGLFYDKLEDGTKKISNNYDATDFFIKLIDELCLESHHFKSLKEYVFDYNWSYIQFSDKNHTNPDDGTIFRNIFEIGIDTSKQVTSRSSRCTKQLIKDHFSKVIGHSVDKNHTFPEVLVVRFIPDPEYLRKKANLKLAMIVEVSTTLYKLCSFFIYTPLHFISYVQGSDTNWYEIDDATVTKLTFKQILEKVEFAHYCTLFYQKTNAPFSDAHIDSLINMFGYSQPRNDVAVSLPFFTISQHEFSPNEVEILYKLYCKFYEQEVVTTSMLNNIKGLFFVVLRKIPSKLTLFYGSPSSTFIVLPGDEEFCILSNTTADKQVFLSNKPYFQYSYEVCKRVFKDSKHHVFY